jgi:hypothetical protein
MGIRFRAFGRSRAWLPMALSVMVAGCDRSPEPIDNLQLPTPLRPAQSTDGRIRYRPMERPVFIASDGSRHPIASLLEVPVKMTFGDFHWADRGVSNGPIWMRVDLTRQLISVFRGADEIGTAIIVYGSDGTATPSGSFALLGKERMHRSRSYDADMPFTLWLTHDGVALHASTVERGRATHGCIGLPPDFARKLFAVARRGNRVFVLPAPPNSRP